MFGGIDDDHIRKLLYAYPSRAINLLYNKYYHNLIKLSFRLTDDAAASEDIVQEVFAMVSEKHRELSHPHSVPIRGFLIKVVKYKSIDFFRQSERIKHKLAEIQHRLKDDVEFPVESHIINREQTAALWALVMSFPKRERECLRLRYEEDLSLDETAERLGISRKSVERSLTSARKRLLRIGKENLGYY
ncbi:MAG: sigma-70 family RNA polymerase sigma factor [Cyclobacteriaceae bacterium]|nr:sigma-70 family RNA polymerase sigma factor [Cyclobacteriaceae bacterium]